MTQYTLLTNAELIREVDNKQDATLLERILAERLHKMQVLYYRRTENGTPLHGHVVSGEKT